MREIKFRAWDGINMRYSDEQFETHISDECDIEVAKCFSISDFFEFNCGDPIMQFTGLIDKNGVEIYEGDVIEYKSSLEIGKGIIEFERGFVISWFEQNTDSPSIISPLFYFGCSSEIEVIGNIHQHPHLLP